jgi:hypothetical protein
MARVYGERERGIRPVDREREGREERGEERDR